MWRGHGVQTSGPLYTTTGGGGGVNNNNSSQIENFFRMGDSSVNARSRGTNFWPTVHVYSEGKKPLGPTYTCTQ